MMLVNYEFKQCLMGLKKAKRQFVITNDFKITCVFHSKGIEIVYNIKEF